MHVRNKTPMLFRFLLAALLVSLSACRASAGDDASAPTRPEGEKLGWPDALHILAGPPGGQWSALGSKMESLFREAGIPAQSHIGGGVENLRLVGEGEADIGFTLYSFLGAAGAGEIELPEVNLDNALLMVNLYPQVLYIIVRKEIAEAHNLKTLYDLLRVKDPIRFATLNKGTGSEFIFNMLLKSAYRTDYDQLEENGWEIAFQSYADITRRFLNGELDVCAYTAGPGTYLIPALEEKKLDAILLPVDEDMLNLMTHQFMTITYIIREGDYKSVTEDIVTLGDYSCLVVQSVIPDNIVYELNRIIWEGKPELAKKSGDIGELSPRFAISGQSKVHPGSVRFWSTPEMDALKDEGKR